MLQLHVMMQYTLAIYISYAVCYISIRLSCPFFLDLAGTIYVQRGVVVIVISLCCWVVISIVSFIFDDKNSKCPQIPGISLSLAQCL